jgi:anti-sigma factor RsiW
MNCAKWQIEISALLDGALSNPEERAVRRHVRDCSICRTFLAEHQDLTYQVERAAALRIDPPQRIWARIEAETRRRQLAAAQRPSSWNPFAWLRTPQLGYALSAAMVLLLAGLLAVQTDSTGSPDPGLLAELDAFTLQTGDNPFLQPVEEGNPFFAPGLDDTGNPFKGGGVSR